MAVLRGIPIGRSCGLAAVLWTAAGLAAGAAPLAAQTLTQDEALALAFPDAERIERRTAYLTAAQLARARALAGEGVSVESEIITHYVALRSGRPIGVAYFDAHRVRTMPEVLMVVVGTDHRIRRIEVLRFQEPPDYRPPQKWLERFQGRVLDGDLSLKGTVPNLTGATLTSGAVTGATRRLLALHSVIAPFEASK